MLFHLVDSRLGFQKADSDVLGMAVKALSDRTQAGLEPFKYVVILTKADKVTKSQIDKTSAAVRKHLTTAHNLPPSDANQVPVLATSARSKLGRNDVWRYFLGAFGSSDAQTMSIPGSTPG